MKTYLLFLSSLFLMSTLTLAQSEKWYKGNLHTHSYWSDGDDFPENIIKWYKDHGYHFLAMSEHNIFAEGEKWINLRKRRHGSQSFERLKNNLLVEPIAYKVEDGDTLVRLSTFLQYKSKFQESGKFLLIPSEEVTDKYKDKPIHLNASNIVDLVEPQHGKTLIDVLQNNIDALNAQRERTNIPMIIHINHPNFGWAMTAQDLIALKGERFFELYNGHNAVKNYGDGTRSGTEAMWDEILSAYLTMNKPCMYGIAVDDSHNYHKMGLDFSNSGRGWIMVKAAELSAKALIEAMETGNFYASTGVELRAIRQNKGKISIKVKAQAGVSYTIQFIGSTKEETGRLLYSQEGPKAAYKLQGNESYVRIKVISNKMQENPHQKGDTEVAWTQPFFPGQEKKL